MRAFVSLLFLAVVCGCTLKPLQLTGGGQTIAAAFSPRGDIVALADAQGIVRVCDTRTGRELARQSGYAANRRAYCSNRVVFSPSGDVLAFAAADASVAVWEWRRSGNDVEGIRFFRGLPLPAFDIAFAKADRLVGVCGTLEHHERRSTERPQSTEVEVAREPLVVVMWDTATGREQSRWQDDGSGALFAALSKDGSRLGAIAMPGVSRSLGDTPASANVHREAIVWNTADGSRAARFDIHGSYLPSCVALSHDGAMLFTSGFSERSAPGVLRCVDTGDTRAVQIRQGVFSTDDQTLAAVEDITKEQGPAMPLFGLPLPPPPQPKIRLRKANVATGELIFDRTIWIESRAQPLTWTSDLSWMIDRNARLWRLSR